MSIYLDIETMGLNAYLDRVTCIGLVEEDGTETAICGQDERQMLNAFAHFMDEREGEEIVTWNGKGFDVPFIMVRILVQRVVPPEDAHQHEDLKELFPKFQFTDRNGYRRWRQPGLGELAETLGLGAKTKHGSEAPALFLEGKFEELQKYCLQDAHLVRALHARLREYRGLLEAVP